MLPEANTLDNLLKCPPGNYCPGTGYNVSCPAGWFALTEGNVICTRCPKRRYSDVIGLSELCTLIDAGEWVRITCKLMCKATVSDTHLLLVH